MPKCMSIVLTRLFDGMFGIGAFSLKFAYFRCIGKQFINVINHKGKLGRIYNGLLHITPSIVHMPLY